MRRTGPFPRWGALTAGLTLALVLVTACGDDSSGEQPAPTASETTTAATAAAPETSTTAAPETTTAPTTTRAPETTTTNASQTTAVPESTTTTEGPDLEPIRFFYQYPSTGELEYSVSIEQQAEVHLEGGLAGEMPPGAIEMNSLLAGTISYHTSPGPEEGTVSVRILSDFQLVENEASMGGFPIPASELGGAPGFETPIDTTVTVDQMGNVLEVSSGAMDDVLGSGGFLPDSSVGNQHFNRPFGPAFPDTPLGVGDSWTERTEQEGPGGPIVTTAEHRVAAVEGTAERPVLVVQSDYEVEAFEWDMSEMLLGMFGAFAEEGGEEGQEVVPEFQLLIGVNSVSVQTTVRFDADLGLVVEGEQQAQGELTTQMTMPGETGDPLTIVTGVKYDQAIFYHLINPGA